MKLLALFFRRFLAHKRRLLGGLLAVPLTRLADIAVTLVIGDAINSLQTGGGIDAINQALLWLTAYALAQAVFSFLQRWWVVSTSRFVERDLKQELFDKLSRLPFTFHTESRSGDLVSRLTSDVEHVRMFLGPGLMFALGGLVMLPVTLVLLLRLNAGLALTMAIPLAIMGLSFRWLTPRLHASSKAVQEGIGEISHRAQENFAGIRVVKGFAREGQQAERFADASKTNLNNQVRLARERGLAHAITATSSQLTMVVILLIGGRAMIRGELGYGDTLIFIDLTLKLFWPIITLGWLAGMYPRATAAAARVDEILSRDVEIRDPVAPREASGPAGEFRLRDVSYTYPGSEEPAVSKIDLDVPAGSVLGIVGPTGCGKSTLLHLFGRLYDSQGTIQQGTVPLDELRLADVRGPLGYVPQDSFLFSDTWTGNVCFGAAVAPDAERLRELAELVCIDREVDAFPDGYEQLIGERGVTLSGGQRQRTCIARALARDPAVLILDDALSAVDTQTEAKLIDHLHTAGQERTVIIAAHRLSSVRAADQILVLSADGTPEALGRHAELAEGTGWYADSWRRQQAREELEEL